MAKKTLRNGTYVVEQWERLFTYQHEPSHVTRRYALRSDGKWLQQSTIGHGIAGQAFRHTDTWRLVKDNSFSETDLTRERLQQDGYRKVPAR